MNTAQQLNRPLRVQRRIQHKQHRSSESTTRLNLAMALNQLKRYKIWNRLLSGLIQGILLAQSIWITVYLSKKFNSKLFLLLTIPMMFILLDAGFVLISRKGKDHKWLSISNLAYSILMLVVIWLLAFAKYVIFENKCHEESTSRVSLNDLSILHDLKSLLITGSRRELSKSGVNCFWVCGNYCASQNAVSYQYTKSKTSRAIVSLSCPYYKRWRHCWLVQ